MTITEFLLARIAEDEDQASLVLLSGVDTSSGIPRIVNRAIRDRVLAECEAKRRIVKAVRKQAEDDDPRAWIVASGAILNALALPYVDHPDYREEWRP